ncbi:MAG: metallophosphoesterase [Alphaproteobacteria bacterium]|nr:metallophosphoesterase [Alphaproteobacteria bacterium]
MLRSSVLFPLLMLACSPALVSTGAGDKDGDDTDAADGPGDDTDAAADTDVEGDTAADTDGDTGDTGDTDTGPPPGPQLVRFVALGDAGEGNDDQYAVADAIEALCAQRGCDFALYLGDNFYDNGVDGVDDPQFQDKFELPYADLDMPFYVVLGNHDFGEIPVQFWKTDYQVEYTQKSTKWTMPDHFYEQQIDHAGFMALDTNMLMFGLGDLQGQTTWVRQTLKKHASATWRFAFGHHPWRSNGQHGNAGNYEGAKWLDPTGIVNGRTIKQFFEAELCGNIDFYFSGHDHNRQWLDPGACGVQFVVSGAGAKTTEFVNRDKNPTRWDDDATEGFLWVELDGRTATLAFYDKAGNLDYEGILTK